DLSPAALVEQALSRGEGQLTDTGALVAYTGTHTGRSPKDRYLVAEASSKSHIAWGAVNRPMEEAVFDRLFDRVRAYLQGRDLFAGDASACADPRHRLPVRVIADKAWHALFAQCLLRSSILDPRSSVLDSGLTVLCASDMHADPATDGTRSDAFIVLHLGRR